MIGESVSHYKIIEQLGAGGMGVVYKARDSKLNRLVALKFLSPQFTHDSEAVDRLVNEAQAASSLDHTNICTIYEINETDDGELFICMAYYDGEPLRSLTDRGRMPVAQALEISMQIARGLQRAHGAGIIHRDLKPGNIIITSHGEAKIIDFGIAKLVSQGQLTKVHTLMGTLAYMSPEQVQGQRVDHRTDLWSLSVMLFEMLYGQSPFSGEQEAALVYAIVNDEPEFPTKQTDRISVALRRHVEKGLSKNPGDRFQSAAEVLDSVTTLQRGLQQTLVVSPPKVARQPRLIARWILLAFVLSSLLAGLFIWQLATQQPPSAQTAYRIAVLPFENLSPNQKDEYFTDGMTEEVIFVLSKIRSLRVVARTSVMQYKNSTKSIATIANELQVENLLEGSVRKSDDRIRVTVKLINADNEEHLWSQEYERILDDVFAVQNDISSQVARALEIRLQTDEESQLRRGRSVNPEAYTNYLKGRYEWNKRSRAGAEAAITYFHQALEQDSLFAPAYSGLADVFGFLGFYNLLPGTVAFSQAKAAAERALRIDPSDYAAHASLASIKMFHEYDFEGARRELESAIAVNPGYASAHQWFAFYYTLAGKHDESLEQIEQARMLDPFSPIMMDDIGEKLYYARRYEQAAAHLRQAASKHGDFFPIYFHLGLALAQLGEFDQAEIAMRRAMELSGSHPGMVGALAWVYALDGNREQANRLIATLDQRGKKEHVPAYYYAMVYAALGEADELFRWLDLAFEERSNWLVLINVEPTFDPYRADPRFVDIAAKIGISH